ncbi:Uncharacterised protein [Klebsiella pneumoniae]|nr:hypothetical protein KPTA6363_034000 [Klebsiella pneumoniae]SVL48416.1 Uncharacterised protein [Klebsiella pneumoniae]SYV39267.1 Uncharacterised protein [Klebsiella pneumoniae]VAT12245.1 Uncharacterised protein [Klebsiella pneumoniae]VGC40977.1 Uncharacterised protein [Klebsiella pneumoniae]
MVLPGGGYALPGLQAPLTDSHPVGPRKRSAAGRDIRHGTLDFAGWRQAPYPAYRILSQAYTPQARASAAPPGEISNTVPVVLPGGGYALPGLQDPLTGSHSVGPRKRSAAGRDIRHGTLDFAGWRLRLTRPTGSSHRLTLRRPAQAQRRRAMASGTVPVVLPGGGCALPGLQALLTGLHPVGPCKRSATRPFHSRASLRWFFCRSFFARLSSSR